MNTHPCNLEEIHDSNVLRKVTSCAEQDIIDFFSDKDKFQIFDCPACNLNIHEKVFECDGFEYQKCKHCRTVFMSPCFTEEMYIDYLQNGESWKTWRNSITNEIKDARKNLHLERSHYVMNAARQYNFIPKKILEIGGGNGEFAEILAQNERVEEVVIIEPQPMNCPHPKISIVSSTLEKAALPEKVSMAVAFEVIEHIINPSIFLNKIYDLMQENGLLVLSTPNYEGYEIEVLGTLSTTVVYDHTRLYNPFSIKLLLERHGFEVLLIETPGKLDIQMILRQVLDGRLDISSNLALEFILEDKELQEKFQTFLQHKRKSSHMRCIAKRRSS